jgi:dissimilatory sulfite reductase (desulfoviridin) alpha/beta subunit
MTKIKHKFNAKPMVIDSIRFSSKKEASYYANLIIRQKASEVLFFLRQVPFHLPGNVRYIVDFVEFWADGSVHFADVKGLRTPTYIMKKKMIEDIYPIEIEEK